MKKPFGTFGVLALVLSLNATHAFSSVDGNAQYLVKSLNDVINAEEQVTAPHLADPCQFTVFEGGEEIPLSAADAIAQAKPILLKIRCGAAGVITGPFFSDFENGGLKPFEIRDKLNGLISKIDTLGFLAPSVLKEALPKLRKARDRMDEASKDENQKNKKISCKTNCDAKTVSCTVDGAEIK